jgi:hypothetical protein
VNIILIKIVNVDVENVDKGNGKSYQLAEVLYDYNGQKRTQKILSFANPAIFKTAKDAQKGEQYEVEIGKNSAGYNQFNSMVLSDGTPSPKPITSSSSSPASGGNTGFTANRSFETAEERAVRQRLIVRQSSLTNAIETLSPGAKAALDPAAVIKQAQDYYDWVFAKPDLFDQPDDLEDVPL